MKKIKVFLSIFFTIAFILSFVGCSAEGSIDNSSTVINNGGDDSDDDSTVEDDPVVEDDPEVVEEPEEPEEPVVTPSVYYTITFVNDTDSVDYTYLEGTVITLPSPTPIKGYANDGTEFDRVPLDWKDLDNNVAYVIGDDFTVTEDVTLTARYNVKTVAVETNTGWIFYDKGFYTDGWRYIEVAKEDTLSYAKYWDSEVNFVLCGTRPASDAGSYVIGSGMQNTLNIIAVSPSDLCGHAAGKTHLSTWGGDENWYVPGAMEWFEIGKVLFSIYEFKSGLGMYYWTSNEADLTTAYIFQPKTGDSGGIVAKSKSYIAKVRAIRYF